MIYDNLDLANNNHLKNFFAGMGTEERVLFSDELFLREISPEFLAEVQPHHPAATTLSTITTATITITTTTTTTTQFFARSCLALPLWRTSSRSP